MTILARFVMLIFHESFLFYIFQWENEQGFPQGAGP